MWDGLGVFEDTGGISNTRTDHRGVLTQSFQTLYSLFVVLAATGAEVEKSKTRGQ